MPALQVLRIFFFSNHKGNGKNIRNFKQKNDFLKIDLGSCMKNINCKEGKREDQFETIRGKEMSVRNTGL